MPEKRILAGRGVAGSINALRQGLGGAGSNKGKLLIIKEDASARVRFLQEPEEWHVFYERFVDGSFVPVVGENDPLDAHPDERVRRVSLRHMVNVLNKETGKVQLLKMNQDLTNRALLKHQRFKTLLDRDYEIMREGSGLQTAYNLEQEDPEPLDLARFKDKLIDMEEYLLQAVDDYHGTSHAEAHRAARAGTAGPATAEEVLTEPEPDPLPFGDTPAQADERQARLDAKYGTTPPWEDAAAAPEAAEPAPAAVATAEGPDPWAQARADGKPCDQGPDGLCSFCGFDIAECLAD
jgi:hypothetical protein